MQVILTAASGMVVGWVFTLSHLPDLGQYHCWEQLADKPSQEIDPHEKNRFCFTSR